MWEVTDDANAEARVIRDSELSADASEYSLMAAGTSGAILDLGQKEVGSLTTAGLTQAVTSDEELRKEALAGLKRKRKLGQNLLAYITVNGVLWIIWALTDRTTDGSIPWPAWVSAIWGFLLLLDAWRALFRWPRSLFSPVTEVEIDREVERLKSR